MKELADFLQRSNRAVSLQVAPFLRDCKGRSYCRDRLTGQTERKTIEFIVILFKLISSLVEPEVTQRIIQLSITTG